MMIFTTEARNVAKESQEENVPPDISITTEDVSTSTDARGIDKQVEQHQFSVDLTMSDCLPIPPEGVVGPN